MGNTPGQYSRVLRRISEDGFNAVETCIWAIEDTKEFCAALKEFGLQLVIMVNTCVPKGDNNGSQELSHHLESFKRQVREALALPLRPLLINSHSGCDSWSFETSKQYFEEALRFEQHEADGILICHETHRGRILYNPWITRDLCRAFPSLHLTADLSHFCVVAERVFAPTDLDWEACMVEFKRATRHIHARVGYAQGPQVPDPRAPEYQDALKAHEQWWDAIMSHLANVEGVKQITVEPEHGTDGYQQRLPFSSVETADIW